MSKDDPLPFSGSPAAAPARRAGKVASTAPVIRTPVRKPHYVRLKNRLTQLLNPSVLSTNGRDVEGITLMPRATSGPIAEDTLTTYTRELIARGHIAIV